MWLEMLLSSLCIWLVVYVPTKLKNLLWGGGEGGYCQWSPGNLRKSTNLYIETVSKANYISTKMAKLSKILTIKVCLFSLYTFEKD